MTLRMRRAEHDINHVRMLRENRRQRFDDVLDPFVRREQAEGQQHRLALYAKLILVKVRIDERHVGTPCGITSIFSGATP